MQRITVILSILALFLGYLLHEENIQKKYSVIQLVFCSYQELAIISQSIHWHEEKNSMYPFRSLFPVSCLTHALAAYFTMLFLCQLSVLLQHVSPPSLDYLWFCFYLKM